MGGTTIVPDEDLGFGEQGFGGTERAADGLMSFERRHVILRSAKENGLDVPQVKIAGHFAEALGSPLLIGGGGEGMEARRNARRRANHQ